MKTGLSNLFKAYFKHVEVNKAIISWANLKKCDKCENIQDRLNTTICKETGKSVIIQIKKECPKKIF